MKPIRKLFRIVLLAVGLSQLTVLGCSLIGLTIGMTSDAQKEDWKGIPGWEVTTLNPGSPIKLVLKNGSTVQGKYAGLEPMPYEQYQEIYNKVRSLEPSDLFLPALGDTLFLNLRPAVGTRDYVKHTGCFKGFDINAVLISKAIDAPDSRFRFDIKRIETMTNSRRDSVTGDKLWEWASKNRLPCLSGIAVLEGTGKRVFAMDRIGQVQVHQRKTGALTGLVVGAAIDALVIAIATSSNSKSKSSPSPSQPPSSSGSSGSSGSLCCPFVYSHDGQNYVLDSETFGGAIFRAAQRTDLDNLDHLAESDGLYRLKLTNELQETQYVDELKLIAVDHPASTRVVPSFEGKLIPFSSPQGPAKAVDFEGNDVSALVRQKDERLWISNPFGRNPHDLNQVRDGLILEFDRPSESPSVKLVFNVQNTLWASVMQGQMLSLQGCELENWYALLNTSAATREALFKAMVREGMLLIKLWDGQTWRDAGFVWEVGPSLPKDQAVRLDLRNVPGPNLKVKLESTAGFWMINSAEADYSPDIPIQTTEIAPFQAFDHLDRDVSGLLCARDGFYYEMPTTQDWAEIVFKALPRPAACRTFVLKSSGYYTIHVTADGEPQRELVKKLMTTPGAYGQYTLDQLNNHVYAAWSGME